jgi:hypothetical protein
MLRPYKCKNIQKKKAGRISVRPYKANWLRQLMAMR